MIRLYCAANLQDAHIVLGLLRGMGIDAHVLNGHAQGGLGEIPFTHTYPEIWLADGRDVERARQIVAGFERTPSGVPGYRCAGCGEEIPASFEWCWNCGALPAPSQA